MISLSSAASSTNSSPIPSDRGYLAWSLPIEATSGQNLLSIAAAAGQLMLVRVCRVPATPITNIVLAVAVAGSTLTAGQCGAALYSAAGERLGVTADQATAWASAGMKVMPITGGPVTLPSVSDVYVGFWWNGTTAPQFARGSAVAAAISNAGRTAPNLALATADTGITTTPPATFGAQSATYPFWWVGLS